MATPRKQEFNDLLPQAPESEKCVLSILFQWLRKALPICKSSITPQHFHIPAHRIIYSTILEMDGVLKGSPNLISVTQKLKDLGHLAEAGGPALVSELQTFAASIEQLEPCLEVLRQKMALRIAVHEGQRIIDTAQNEQDKAAEIPGLLRGLIGRILQAGESKVNISLTETALADLNKNIGMRQRGEETAITSGLPFWDDVLHGIIPKRFYVIGARPKMGKSALMEQAAAEQAEKGIPVLIFERDMSIDDLIGRIACRKAKVIFEDYINATISEEDLMSVQIATEEIDPKLLRIYSPHNMTAHEMASVIEREVNENGVKVFWLDLFQRLQVGDQDLVQGYVEASNVIRNVIQNTGVSGIVLAEILKDADKSGRPTSSMFKYCDGLFSSCDTSIMLWTKDDPKKLVDEKTKQYRRQKVFFTVDANRGGAVSDNEIYFDRPHMTFYDTP